jgi:large subunit ribosomal protein L18
MSTSTLEARRRRHRRVRGRVTGSAERPRLSVARSNKRIYAQLIDDERGHTVAAAGSHEAALRGLSKGEAAGAVGKLLAERATGAGVTRVVFDRGGYKYHGRVRALAEGAREGGLEF